MYGINCGRCFCHRVVACISLTPWSLLGLMSWQPTTRAAPAPTWQLLVDICKYNLMKICMFGVSNNALYFKPGAQATHAWFLEIGLVCTSVCMSVSVSVCLPPRALITSGVIWCDIGHVRLAKQVSRLFPALNYFI